MHAGKLIEVATQLSFHAEQIARQATEEIVPSEAFWKASRAKLEHWNRALALFREDLTGEPLAYNSWAAISCVVEEILCSEFFARIVGATFVLQDRHQGLNLNGPVARSILLFHLEARMRALELIETGLRRDVPEAKSLNDLRRRLESWCDLLLAFFPANIASEFAFDSCRHLEFKKDLAEENETSRQNVQRLLQVSIQEHGRKLANRPVANPKLNRQIAELFQFMDRLSAETSDDWTLESITSLTDEAERWIEDYLLVS